MVRSISPLISVAKQIGLPLTIHGMMDMNTILASMQYLLRTVNYLEMIDSS